MKKLMLSSAILAATTVVASAQDATAEMFRSAADPSEIHASDFISKRVYASEVAVDADEYAGVQTDWNDIGEINDVILSRDGSVEAVLVDIGGFLGIGERQVAVDMSAIRFVADGATADDLNDYFLVMNAPRASLEAAPEYSMGAPMATDPAATDNAAAMEVAPVTDTAATTDTAVTADPATPDTAATDTAATDDSMMPAPMARDGYAAALPTDLTAEMLTGAKVYDPTDASVGTISDLILTEDGQVKEVVIDVGGFLGMGKKPVLLTLEQIEILREDGGDDVRVYVPMTKDELEALPEYKA